MLSRSRKEHKNCEEEITMDYRNPALTVPQRVKDLIARMNLREKVAQLCCCTLPHPLDDAALDKLFRYGMGTVSYLNSALSGDQQLKMAVSCAHASLELPGT